MGLLDFLPRVRQEDLSLSNMYVIYEATTSNQVTCLSTKTVFTSAYLSQEIVLAPEKQQIVFSTLWLLYGLNEWDTTYE